MATAGLASCRCRVMAVLAVGVLTVSLACGVCRSPIDPRLEVPRFDAPAASTSTHAKTADTHTAY